MGVELCGYRQGFQPGDGDWRWESLNRRSVWESFLGMVSFLDVGDFGDEHQRGLAVFFRGSM